MESGETASWRSELSDEAWWWELNGWVKWIFQSNIDGMKNKLRGGLHLAKSREYVSKSYCIYLNQAGLINIKWNTHVKSFLQILLYYEWFFIKKNLPSLKLLVIYISWRTNDWGDVGETGRVQNAYVFSFVFIAWHIYSINHVLLNMCYS